MSVDPKKISEFALRLRNADPQLYEQFIRLLDQYTYEITVAVTNAPADTVLNSQGRAQQAQKFFQLLTELREPPANPKPTP